MTRSRRHDAGRLGLVGWARLFGIMLARVALGMVVVGALCTVAPLAFGWTSVMVVSGSMMPNIRPGDVVVARPVDGADVKPGQPVLVDNPAKPGHLLLHRVVRRNPDGTLTTKGDANQAEDSSPVPLSSVRARPRLLVRGIGLPLLWQEHGEYGPLAVVVLGFVGVMAAAMAPDVARTRRVRTQPKLAPQHRYRRHPRWRTRFRRRRRPPTVPLTPARTVACGAAVLTVLAVGAAQGSYVSIKSTGSSSWAAGDVKFNANSPAGALFALTGVIAGSFGTQCVKLTYSGTLAATVKMYVSALSGTGLETYLGVQVRSGTGNAANCSDFAATTTDYNTLGLTDTSKTLATLRAASYDYSTGISNWSTSSSTTRTYQVSWFVLPDNTAQSRTVSFDLTWEARS